jgi:hypothetical protein
MPEVLCRVCRVCHASLADFPPHGFIVFFSSFCSKGVYVNLCAKAMQVLKRGE